MEAGVYLGDWLHLAPRLAAGSVDFLYSDPPFNTGREHVTPRNAHRRSGAPPAAVAHLSVVPEELDSSRTGTASEAAFCDSFASTAHYIAWLRERLVATMPALKRSATVAIHCDFRASHHVRLLLDELLTPENFVNHLIWHYGLGGSSPRRFARKHDDILVYCLDPELYYFDPPLVPATSNRLKGKMKKATDVVRVGREQHQEESNAPLGEWGHPEGYPQNCPEGRDDVLDVPSLNNMSRERTGYPTQKPLALLTLLVGAFCPIGGMVLDPTCGSGTSLLAARNAGRRGIGFDRGEAAVRTARGRLASA
jgi:site-specific DNA-methyltransferase (adenine-specific)